MDTEQKHLRNILIKLANLTEDVQKLIADKNKEWKNNNNVEFSITACDDLSDEDQFFKHKSENSAVRLNVDGSIFLTSWAEMCQYPESRLGKLGEALSIKDILQLCDNYNAKDNEFYFKKRSKNFGEILDFYRNGSLHITDFNCVIAFDQELHYWKIPSYFLETCCAKRLTDAKETIETQDEHLEKITMEQFPSGAKGKIQKYLWDLFEYPHSSFGAKLVAIISATSIMLSIIILTLNTFPYFQNHEDQIFDEYSVFAVMEAIYNSWFTLEFFIRLICCPSKLLFMKRIMNWIDLLAILPYFISLAVHFILLSKIEDDSMDSETVQDTRNNVLLIPQVFRLLRILKIFRFIARFLKLARHSIGMQALGYTIKSNYKELSLVLLFLGMGSIIFSSIIFVFESEVEGSQFQTMLDGYWWAIITMTTVGYGDISPVTRMGKVIGTFCAIFGVLVVALPIPIIGSSFNKFYTREHKRQQFMATQIRRKGEARKGSMKAECERGEEAETGPHETLF